MLLKQFGIVPKHVPAMDARGNRIDLAVLSHQVRHQFLRKGFIPSVTLVKFGDRFTVTGFYVLTEQFPTGMALPAVGRITSGQTGLQNRPCSGTSTARYCRV